MVKQVTILGATGSIGRNTVALMSEHRESFACIALTAQENVMLLAEQARLLHAKYAVIGNPAYYAELKSLLAHSGTEAAAGPDAIIQAAAMPSDMVVAAIVGAAGLMPTFAAITRGATVALANKECLVCAGEFITRAARESGAVLLPVDSEHSAIFQVFDFERPETVEKIIITASGGPFRTASLDTMRQATPASATRHPNWSMGAKISVDSATMMNKGLEIIEAFHLFPVGVEQIEVLVHPESIVHSLVRYRDGSVLAQLGTPDMCTPIAHALAWPERITVARPTLDLAAVGSLHFETPDEIRFPALKLARQALEAGGNAPAILNAANEMAVARFLRGEIGFLSIVRLAQETLSLIENTPLHGLEDVIEIDRRSRAIAEQMAIECISDS